MFSSIVETHTRYPPPGRSNRLSRRATPWAHHSNTRHDQDFMMVQLPRPITTGYPGVAGPRLIPYKLPRPVH